MPNGGRRLLQQPHAQARTCQAGVCTARLPRKVSRLAKLHNLERPLLPPKSQPPIECDPGDFGALKVQTQRIFQFEHQTFLDAGRDGRPLCVRGCRCPETFRKLLPAFSPNDVKSKDQLHFYKQMVQLSPRNSGHLYRSVRRRSNVAVSINVGIVLRHWVGWSRGFTIVAAFSNLRHHRSQQLELLVSLLHFFFSFLDLVQHR